MELENVALRHQIGVLRRSAKKRPKLTPADRLVWVILSRIWGDWRSALAIVKLSHFSIQCLRKLTKSSGPAVMW